jgi:acyl carrier protein phosphodiesterase
MPYMINNNWLLSYATTSGISKILTQMDNRTRHRSGMKHSINELQEFYAEFEEEFTVFFESLRAFAEDKLAELSYE